MFANFIHFILALLIYATHQPSENPYFSHGQSLVLFAVVSAVYAVSARAQFRSLENRLPGIGPAAGEQQFNGLLTRQTILAILFFALDIYGLNLSSVLIAHPLFRRLPTLTALVFMAIFIGYLAVMWAAAFPAYRQLYRSELSRAAYVISNIRFGLPVLLPWFVLSGAADLIDILPFPAAQRFLATTEGQITYFLVFLIAVSLVGPVIIKTFWRCVPLESGTHRRRIETLCRNAGVLYRDILRWPIFEGRMITAGVMGLVGRFRYILVTDALLHLLDPAELEAVIAHEIGHVRHRHLLFYLFFFIGYMIMSFALFDLIFYLIIYLDPVIHLFRGSGLSDGTIVSAAMSVLLIAAFLIYFRFVFGYFMRHFERQADMHVFRLFDSARPLISTLTKIAATSIQSMDKPNWHHFSIRQRIEYLLKCETDRRWIRIHHRRLKRHLLIYTGCLLLIGAVGYQLNYGSAGKILNEHFFEKVVIREIDRSPHRPELLTTLGDLYYGRGEHQRAAEAYGRAIAVDPRSVRALNNLAWLYATADNGALKQPHKALALAQRAATLDPQAHVLDTLAESYYAAGQLEKAVDTAEQALNSAQKDRGYYEDQLQKFETALAQQMQR